MAVETFGALPDGSRIDAVTLTRGGLAAEIIGYGAALRRLDLATSAGPVPLVLGLATLGDYLRHSPYMGAIAGRYANRIGGGRFTLDGVSHDLPRNERDRTHLHGGPQGFSQRSWDLLDAGPDAATFRLISAAGDQGYPGRLETTCSYSLDDHGQLTIELVATTDAPTIVNLATHSYFNLDGVGDILDHVLEVPADTYTPVDADLVPTGEIRSVTGTPFDFRQARTVRHEVDGRRTGYDVNLCVGRDRLAAPRPVARLMGARRGITLALASTEPGLQFYDGAALDLPVAGLGGRRIGAHAGLCLEPQLFPDTPNQPDFGSAVLRPGEIYRQITRYAISEG